MASSIINVAKLSELISDDRNMYSYTRLKNIMSGAKKKTKRSEITKIRKVLRREFDRVDDMLAKLEEQGS